MPPLAPKFFIQFSAPKAGPLTVEALQENPFVPGVSVIETGPAKGHTFFDSATGGMVPVFVDTRTLQTVVAACASYSGGVRVNAGHFTELKEAAGRLTGFRIEGDKVRATLELFRSYAGFLHLCELIAKIPETFGLSIDFDGEAEVIDSKAYPRVTEINSADIVPTPAANRGGLFQARPSLAHAPAPAPFAASAVYESSAMRTLAAWQSRELAAMAASAAQLSKPVVTEPRRVETTEAAIGRLLKRR